MPFEKIRTNVSWYQGGVNNTTVIGALAGPTPSAVYAFIVKTAAINGTDGLVNSMQMAPLDGTYLTDVTLSIGGSRTYVCTPTARLCC